MEATPISTESPSPQADLQEVLRLKELFATLPDPRVAGRVLHSLPEVLLVALCAMICDCEDFTDMGHFARSQLPWMRQFIPLRNGAPSHSKVTKRTRTKPSPHTSRACVPRRRPQSQAHKAGRRVAK